MKQVSQPEIISIRTNTQRDQPVVSDRKRYTTSYEQKRFRIHQPIENDDATKRSTTHEQHFRKDLFNSTGLLSKISSQFAPHAD
jgi:hypothetical protein